MWCFQSAAPTVRLVQLPCYGWNALVVQCIPAAGRHA
jgi:hypothetical protein